MEARLFFALTDDVVTGKISASRESWDDAPAQPDLLQVDADTFQSVSMGSRYESSTGTFTPPAPATTSRRLGKYAFVRLLTPSEYAAMFGQQSDSTLAYGVACFQAAPDPFDIDDPLVAQMLNYCVAAGVLTQARRDTLWASMEQAARAN
jgi:ferredoxin